MGILSPINPWDLARTAGFDLTASMNHMLPPTLAQMDYVTSLTARRGLSEHIVSQIHIARRFAQSTWSLPQDTHRLSRSGITNTRPVMLAERALHTGAAFLIGLGFGNQVIQNHISNSSRHRDVLELRQMIGDNTELRTALEQSRWTVEQQHWLLKQIAEGIAQNQQKRMTATKATHRYSREDREQIIAGFQEEISPAIKWAYAALPSAIQTMRFWSCWDRGQQLTLLVKLAEKGGCQVDKVYRHLLPAVRAMAKTRWNGGQRSRLLLDLAEAGGHFMQATYEQLASAISGMAPTNWDFEQQHALLTTLAKNGGSDGFQHLPVAIHGLASLSCASQQKHQFLLLLANNGKHFVDEAFKAIPNAIQCLANTGWTEQQKLTLLTQLAENAGLRVGWEWGALTTTLREWEATGWSSMQKYNLLTKLAAQTNNPFDLHCRALLTALRALQEADWHIEQQYHFLTCLAEKPTDDFKQLFDCVPSVVTRISTLGWSVRQQYQFLTLLVRDLKRNAGQVLNKLPDVLITLRDKGWNFEQQDQLVTLVAQSGHANLHYLHFAIKGLSRCWMSSAEQFYYLVSVTRRAGQGAGAAYQILDWLFLNLDRHSGPTMADHFLRFLSGLNDYNAWQVLNELNNHREFFTKTLTPSQLTQHLSLYAEIFARWPRLGFNIMEGLIEATKAGILPKELDREKDSIFALVEKTHGFHPSIYKAYRQRGEALFEELAGYVSKILDDDFGLAEMQKIQDEHGEEFLLGVIQMASPTSGASYVKREEHLDLLRKIRTAGDLRAHVPSSWKGKLETFEQELGQWQIRTGENADPLGKVSAMLARLRSRKGQEPVTQDQLVTVLADYLNAKTPEERSVKHQSVLALLYKLAGQDDALREKIERIHSLDYTALTLLEQLFSDKDLLQKILADALNQVPNDVLASQAKKQPLEGNAQKLIKAIKDLWNKALPTDKKILILGNMLASYHPADIAEKIIPRVDGTLRLAITSAMEAVPVTNKNCILQELLEEPLRLIRTERKKYTYTNAGRITVGLRAVKGPAFGLHGLSSGVCTARDTALWKNPSFKLLAITDETHHEAVGYIHVFETTIAGKKYLTLPGINPSVEFLSRIDAATFYNNLMNQVIKFAIAGGYAGVYLPTDPSILSNRSDIVRQVVREKYRLRTIPEIKWNTTPRPYRFSEVYVVWER